VGVESLAEAVAAVDAVYQSDEVMSYKNKEIRS
jgi:hypothetical protein